MKSSRENRVIETPRLLIRLPQADDVKAILKICNSEHVLRYNAMNKVSTAELIKKFETPHESYWTFHLVCKESNEIIGAVFIEPDTLRYKVRSVSISYYLDEAKTQNGYMHEALNEVLNYIFTILKMDIVTARVFSPNIASIRLLKKLGFLHEGTLRHAVCGYEDVIYDDLLFSLFKSEFEYLENKKTISK
ncbi:MAG: GNAT family N-acetyltransferase [Beduini sp.]|uniref:GNAT family N-acetyltransferase n=3 Tax=Beduini sp. TaxID=1922300 RepID=UPI00399098A2